jgi:glyceraldehyde-3-phosphate dehydrogenase/erythrose-4-phosphate dehydrogenase
MTPVMEVINCSMGVEKAIMMTIHAYTVIQIPMDISDVRRIYSEMPPLP